MKQQITVVTLGPGDPQLMTLQTADVLRGGGKLILRTQRHPVAAWLREQAISFESLDALYDEYENFDDLHSAMAARLWQEALCAPVVFAVADASCDGALAALKAAKPADAQLTCLPGVSRADACLSQLGAGDRGIFIVPASACAGAAHHPNRPLLITELDSRVLAGDVKLWLGDVYDDAYEIMFFSSSVSADGRPVAMPLWEMDRQKAYDHTVCVYLPPAGLEERQRYCFDDLLAIMEILRGENGCPWDRKQTHETLRGCIIEEAWETAAAIDEGDPDHLADELGDVLLQVVLHSAIGQSHGTFAIGDVTSAICRKMIFRHPHIFGTARLGNTDEINARWEQLKKQERALTSHTSVLKDVPQGISALMRAHKVQKKAALVGFDWDGPTQALPKVYEEADEVRGELEASRDPGEELGDLLFSCVNVARLCGVDAEAALMKATEKFINRFEMMENSINSDGKSLEYLTLAEMDVYWNQVKKTQVNH